MTELSEKADELRKKLTERGIEYAESQDRFRTRFRLNYSEACGDYLNEIEVMGACITASKSYLTSEQAIAATLGGGKLTAEQVMAIAGKHQPDYCSDTHVCFDWQAIADELNATLGRGECEAIHDKSYYKGIHGYCEGLKCSNCGEPLFSAFYYCPWCGHKLGGDA